MANRKEKKKGKKELLFQEFTESKAWDTGRSPLEDQGVGLRSLDMHFISAGVFRLFAFSAEF